MLRAINVVNARKQLRADPQWGVWDDEKGNSKNGLQQTYDYTDMLAMSAWLNLLVRKHKDIGIACLAQSVNVVSRQIKSQGCSLPTPDLSYPHQSDGDPAANDILSP